MKKMSLFMLGSMLTLSVFAQRNIQLGIKGGVNISSINDEDRVPDGQVEPRIGFHAGLLAHIHLTPNWAIQPEVVYSKEGAKYESPIASGKSDLNYVNVPVLLQYMTAQGFRVETGPQLGLLTSARGDNGSNENLKNDIDKTNFSWAFGLGYLTPSGFGIDARFNLGLSNLYKEGVYPGQKAKSRVGQIGLFYQFRH